MNIIKWKSGFTLLEMLLVLFTLSLSLILAVPYAKQASIRYESKVMMRNVMQHFEYAHKKTMVRKGYYFVRFTDNQVEFSAELLKNSPEDKTFTFPEEVTFSSAKEIKLLASGDVKPQTITLITPTKNYQIVFQFSGGRYVFEES